jgi:L-histidine Nalpha-methyltransferase
MAHSFALRTDRSALSPDVAGELRDALGRRQKELPARWLAAVDVAALREGGAPPIHEHESLERELGLALLRDQLPAARPRGVVCIQPSASAVNLTLADALCQRGSVMSISAAELDSKLAVEMIERIASSTICASSSAVACDCTIELPLPDGFPRPRVYLCLGNVLGATTAVGAVRLLRILRTTMTPGDSVVLGLEPRRNATGRARTDEEFEAAASRHLGALGVVNTMVGGGFDLARFEFRATFDAENSRFETHLVARRAHEVEVPGVCAIRLRKGESIRTSVRCLFDRNRVAAMLAGVGLTLRDWNSDAEERYVVALATPAV